MLRTVLFEKNGSFFLLKTTGFLFDSQKNQ